MRTLAITSTSMTLVAVIACGPSVSSTTDGTDGTDGTDSSTQCRGDAVDCTTTVADGNSTRGVTSSTSESGFDGDETSDTSASSSDTGNSGPEITCPLPDAPNADVTVLVDGKTVSFQYAWNGPAGGGTCVDSDVLVLTPNLSTFVEGWPNLTPGEGSPTGKFSTSLTVYTRQTVATEYPADVTLRVNGGDVSSAHGLTSWTKEGDPNTPNLVGEIIELEGGFSASGTFDARWCPQVSSPPCTE